MRAFQWTLVDILEMHFLSFRRAVILGRMFLHTKIFDFFDLDKDLSHSAMHGHCH